jgi:hypothetical protein
MSVYLKDRPSESRFLILITWEHDPPQCWRADLRQDSGALIATAAGDKISVAVDAALDKARADRKSAAASKVPSPPPAPAPSSQSLPSIPRLRPIRRRVKKLTAPEFVDAQRAVDESNDPSALRFCPEE